MSELKKTGLAIPEPLFIQKLETMQDMMDFGTSFIKSGFAPKHLDKPESVMVAIMYGTSIGLKVAASLQQVVVVNGLPSLKGDAAKALIISSGVCTEWKETTTGTLESEDFVYSITAKRSDGQEMTSSFSMFDAKRAGLWVSDDDLKRDHNKKFSAWYKYPTRMIRYRALGFLARDLFPDVLQGMVTEEEAKDYVPFEEVVTRTKSVQVTTEEAQPEAQEEVFKGGEMHIGDNRRGGTHVGEATTKMKKKAVKLPGMNKTSPEQRLELCSSAAEIYSNLSKDEMKAIMMEKQIPFASNTTAADMAESLWSWKEDQKEIAASSEVQGPAPVVEPPVAPPENQEVILESQVEYSEVAREEKPPVEEVPFTTDTLQPKPASKFVKPTPPAEPESDGKTLVKAEILGYVKKLPASKGGVRELEDMSDIWQLVEGNWNSDEQNTAIAAAGLTGDLEVVLNVNTPEEIEAFVKAL